MSTVPHDAALPNVEVCTSQSLGSLMLLTCHGRSQKAASLCQEPAIASEPGVHRRHGSFDRPPDPGPSTARDRGLNRPQRV